MNTLEVTRNKQPARRMVGIQADSSSALPQKLEIIKAGDWKQSIKGDIQITLEDLHEFKRNADAGVAQFKDQNGKPIGVFIDCAHENRKEAAMWLKQFEVEGDTLYATEVEYTTLGRAKIEGGEYKGFSPSFYPRCLGQWHDPEDPTITASNVLTGGGLTNIPFFKGLAAIMADESSGNDQGNIYISADVEGDKMPTLQEVLAKKPSEINADEKQILADNKASLTADQLIAFGLEDKPAPKVEADAVTGITDDQAQILADISSGKKVLVEASEHNELKAKVDANAAIIGGYEKTRVEASIDKAVARGAIVADQKEDWTKRILADSSLESVLTALPSNEILAASIGTDGQNAEVLASIELEKKARDLITADTSLSIGDAYSQVRKDDPELAKRYDEEIKG